MKITTKVIQGINSSRISLDELAYIYSLYFNENWEINIFPASIIKLQRLNILDSELGITAVGETVLFDCLDEDKVVVPAEDKFDELWLLFPKDDEFKSFPRTRTIRTNKAQAKTEYYNTLAKGYTHEQLVNALKNEVIYRSESTKENLFKYMRSPINWFKNESYLDFVDINIVKPDEYGKEIL